MHDHEAWKIKICSLILLSCSIDRPQYYIMMLPSLSNLSYYSQFVKLHMRVFVVHEVHYDSTHFPFCMLCYSFSKYLF